MFIWGWWWCGVGGGAGVYRRLYGRKFSFTDVQRNFRPYNRRYTSPNEHFEYNYPHSNALFNIYTSKAQYFAPNWSFASIVKQVCQPITSDVTYGAVLRLYIAEYTDANSWRYPIRRHVTFTSVLEYQTHVCLCIWGPYFRLAFVPNMLSSWNKLIILLLLLSWPYRKFFFSPTHEGSTCLLFGCSADSA